MNNIVMMPIKAIHPYDKNPRNNADAIDKVKESLKEFGFRQPIVVDKNKTIIVGHTRFQAAKKLNMKEVPVLIADDMSEEQVKAYRIADNSTAEYSTWDKSLLSEELDEITNIDMSFFGIDFDSFAFHFDDIADFQGYDKHRDDREYFEKALTFPINKKVEITSYFKKHLDEIQNEIIEKACNEYKKRH